MITGPTACVPWNSVVFLTHRHVVYVIHHVAWCEQVQKDAAVSNHATCQEKRYEGDRAVPISQSGEGERKNSGKLRSNSLKKKKEKRKCDGMMIALSLPRSRSRFSLAREHISRSTHSKRGLMERRRRATESSGNREAFEVQDERAKEKNGTGKKREEITRKKNEEEGKHGKVLVQDIDARKLSPFRG